jgi:Ni,Fe-hydrogenase maturation factor
MSSGTKKIVQCVIERDPYETTETYELRVKFITECLKLNIKFKRATMLSRVYANKCNIGCKYSDEIEKEIKTILSQIRSNKIKTNLSS